MHQEAEELNTTLRARPLRAARTDSPNRSGAFMEINVGKRAISLNVKHPRGRDLLARLVGESDILGEGFSPGTMERMGFGYSHLAELNPSLIYVQQSGMGQAGVYGNLRSYGPVAQAFSGMSEMSGLPEPYPPAGIGYSFLDWFGAYNMAVAALAGLHRRTVTGKGCWIDSSQVEAGTYLTGTAILDFSANGRRWSRFGNRSPYKRAAPNGRISRTLGEDRWIAISCFSEQEWLGLTKSFVAMNGGEIRGLQFVRETRKSGRTRATCRQSDHQMGRLQLMYALQHQGVPAGCARRQRIDAILILIKNSGRLVELDQTEIGTWPCKNFPVKFDETPTHIGGIVDRHGQIMARTMSMYTATFLALAFVKFVN